MELFQENIQGENYLYLLDEIPEDYGVENLNPDFRLVALFKPTNGVHTVSFNKDITTDEIQDLFQLNHDQSQELAKLLNRHIPK